LIDGVMSVQADISKSLTKSFFTGTIFLLVVIELITHHMNTVF